MPRAPLLSGARSEAARQRAVRGPDDRFQGPPSPSRSSPTTRFGTDVVSFAAAIVCRSSSRRRGSRRHVVIDNSSAYRMTETGLVIPEINRGHRNAQGDHRQPELLGDHFDTPLWPLHRDSASGVSGVHLPGGLGRRRRDDGGAGGLHARASLRGSRCAARPSASLCLQPLQPQQRGRSRHQATTAMS